MSFSATFGVLDPLPDFPCHEIADQRIGFAVDQYVAKIALPDAKAALGIELFEERLALFIADFESAAWIRRMQETGKGFLATPEHLGIAGLDLLLRLGVDLAVMQRCAPVRGALEYGEVSDTCSDGLDGLNTGGAGPDHRHALPGEVDRLLRPARGMEGAALKIFDALDSWHGRCRQRADRGDQEACAKTAAVLERDVPAPRRLVPNR